LSGAAFKSGAGKRKAWALPGPRLGLLVGGLALCASLAAGLIASDVVRRDDEHVLQLQHRLVRGAAAPLHRRALDAEAAAAVAQSTGVAGLMFEPDPAVNGRA
jgi:hypothetical protein